jgi:hypothetical protein
MGATYEAIIASTWLRNKGIEMAEKCLWGSTA